MADIDKFSPEMNSDITKPAGAGDVPLAYKMMATLAVKRGSSLAVKEMGEFPANTDLRMGTDTGHIPSRSTLM